MSRLILPSRKIWTPPQRQRGYVVLDAYRGGGGSDPDYAHTVLQLHCNGDDASPTLTDSSSYARTMTRVGTAEIDTAQSVFGGASAYIPASTNGWTTPGHSSLDMRAGAFQFDWRQRLAANLTSTSQPDTVAAMMNGDTWAYEWALLVWRNYIQFYYGQYSVSSGGIRWLLPAGFDFGTLGGTFVALSVARTSAGNWGAWIDGARCTQYQYKVQSSASSWGSVVTGTCNDSADIGASSGKLFNLGRYRDLSGNAVTKHIDEFRYVVGQCRDVTSGYTPRTTPFPDS